ncbi:MAG TPA: CHAT domain-containing protein, partial [Nonomuraea sp.]|nr:CHAT domain-containing protein [Nonomuraea sp.]
IPTTIDARTREAQGKERSADRERDKVVDLQKQIARKHSDLVAAEKALAREEEQARRKQADTDRRAAEAQRRTTEEQRRTSERQAQSYERELSTLRGQVGGVESELSAVRTALARELPDVATVLLLFADPSGTLRLDREMRAIHQAVRLSEQRDHIRLEARWAARPSDISQAILDTNPTVVHFSGHGTNSSELAFEGNEGSVRVIEPEDLVGLVRAIGQSVRVILYNACWSANAAAAMADRVEVAIGMDAPVTDQGARAFAEGFYRGIGAGRSVADAFEVGRFELRNSPAPRATDAEPVLKCRADVDAATVFLVAPRSDPPSPAGPWLAK